MPTDLFSDHNCAPAAAGIPAALPMTWSAISRVLDQDRTGRVNLHVKMAMIVALDFWPKNQRHAATQPLAAQHEERSFRMKVRWI